jgi:hypothetical protein
MFIQITKDKSIRLKDVIGVFDLDTSTVSGATKSFLSRAEKDNKTVGINILPKSFILTDSNNIFGGNKIYDKNNKNDRNDKKSKEFKIYFSSNMTGYIDKSKLKRE